MSLTPTPLKGALGKAEKQLAAHAAAYPEVHEDQPWGHRAFKVRKKAFLFLASDGGVLSLSVKLPESATLALKEAFTEPTGYGLGRAGWVSARFSAGDAVPVARLEQWIDESFRAIAPARVVTALGGRKPVAAAKPTRRPASTKRAR